MTSDRYRVRFTEEECKPRCTWLPSETEGIDGECAYIRKGPRNTLYKRPCGTHPKDVQRLETMIKVVKKLGFGPDSSKYAQVLVDKTSLKNTLDNLKTFDRNLLNGKDALDKDVINQNVNNILSTIIQQISPKDKKELQNNPALQANLVVFMSAHNTPKVIQQEIAHLAKKTPILDAMSDKLKAKLTSQKPSQENKVLSTIADAPSKVQLENLLTVNNVVIEALTQETENLSNKLVDHTIVIETLQAELQVQQVSHQTQLSTLVAEVPSKSSEILLAAQHSKELEKLHKISDAAIKILVENHTQESDELNLKFHALTTKLADSDIKNAAIQAELQVQKDNHQAQLSTLLSIEPCSVKEAQLVAQHSKKLEELHEISNNTIDSLSATHTVETTLLQKEIRAEVDLKNNLTTKLVESEIKNAAIQAELQVQKDSHQAQLSTLISNESCSVKEAQLVAQHSKKLEGLHEISNNTIDSLSATHQAEIERQNITLSKANQQITELRKELEKIQESMSTHRKILTETKQFKNELGLDATSEVLQQLQDISTHSTKTLKDLQKKRKIIKASGYIRS
jgi:hypothetical protein